MNEQAPVQPYKTLFVKRGLTEIKTLLHLVNTTGGFVGGGYARYCLSPLPKPALPSDVDIFCKSAGAYDLIVDEIVRRGGKVKIKTVNATTIVPPSEWIACPMIQVIAPEVMVGDPWSIISRFDFTIAIAALTWGDQGIVHPDFEEHEYNQKLVINYIQCPIGNSRRMHKYLKKGYKVSVKEMVKFFKDWESKSEERRQQILDLVDMDPQDWTEQTRERFRDLIYID